MAYILTSDSSEYLSKAEDVKIYIFQATKDNYWLIDFLQFLQKIFLSLDSGLREEIFLTAEVNNW